jgi:hypothetical protein
MAKKSSKPMMPMPMAMKKGASKSAMGEDMRMMTAKKTKKKGGRGC